MIKKERCMEQDWVKRYNKVYEKYSRTQKMVHLNVKELEVIFEEMDTCPMELTEQSELLKLQIAGVVTIWALEKHMCEEYMKYAHAFYNLTLKYDERTKDHLILNKKAALHYLSCYYIENNQRMIAESYLVEAVELLDSYPNESINFYIILNLCTNFSAQNHVEEIEPLARELYCGILDGKYNQLVERKELYRGIIIFSLITEILKNRKAAARVIQTALESGIVEDTEDCKELSYLYVGFVRLFVGTHKQLNEKERRSLMQCLSKVANSASFFHFNAVEKTDYLVTKALLYWKMGDVSVMDEVVQMLPEMISKMRSFETTAYMSNCCIVAAICMECQKYEEAAEISGILLKMNRTILEKVLSYQNRIRLAEYTANSKSVFYMAYSIYSCLKNDKELYQILLNFKKDISFVTDFRNYLLKDLENVQGLVEEINHFQNQIAENYVGVYWGKAAELDEIEERICKLEYEFARKIDEKYRLEEFTMEEVLLNIPDNSAFLEYVVYYEEYYKRYVDADYAEIEFINTKKRVDLFCFVKKNGFCDVKRIMLDNTEQLFRELELYTQEMGKKFHRKLDKSRKFLYECLIQPVQEYLADVDCLYIAPDEELCNLPFDVLTKEAGGMLGDTVNIIMIDTGRDFLKKHEMNFGGRYIVVGNPAYTNEADDSGEERYRDGSGEKEIHGLPFSELEAYVVAEEIQCKPYIGSEAGKQILEEMQNARWVHIATHGIYDEELITDGWYSSALLFAGAESWRKTGISVKEYGNGIVTADEISRMQLGQTELVVLSACYGGRIQPEMLAGICAAFRAAGVQYIVSALWEVDDIATSVFMAKFYQYLKELEVSEALRKTKSYLKNITVKELKRFIECTLKKYKLRNAVKIQEVLEYLADISAKKTEDYKLYEDPFYWSAFTCTKTAF